MTEVSSGATMKAVVTTGVGDYDRLVYTDVPIPVPGPGEVLLQVLAAGVNNTEINTRLGWYSSSSSPDGGWDKSTPFPLIQGADCCGRIVQVGPGGDASTIGARVLVRACMRVEGFSSPQTVWLGSDLAGAFAQHVVVSAQEAFPVQCDWTDAELATVPCAYGTAENMVHRAGVTEDSQVVVTGASGGVGSAVVQLARRRGARVTGIAGLEKHDRVRALGAHTVIDRDLDPVEVLGESSVDVVIDNVAGPRFGAMLDLLRRSGTYVSSGAIGGPLVDLDMRTFYLKDLTLLGCTAWDEPVFPHVISYIERGEIKPLLERTFPLEQIATAQQEFLRKRHVGSFALIPPTPH
ncbi:alcohol dehydrogenase family protein [Aeromicrobium sp.]|uniref:alcohol dehydrogenase family protein n=1 Tax=Aeromicrobium sp. TaxID=1871063 RepID=UPI003C653F7F